MDTGGRAAGRGRSASGIGLILLCGLFSAWCGPLLLRDSEFLMIDFKIAYYGTRCLLAGVDPYQTGAVLHAYAAAAGAEADSPEIVQRGMNVPVYLPTAFPLNAPFAVLPWGLAELLWLIGSMAGLTTAGLLAWRVGARSAPRVSLVLVCFMLGNSLMLAALGNSAALATAFCVAAAVLLVEQRTEWLGIACLALSLVMKPHNAGLIWLLLLLAGGALFRRMWQTAGVVALLAVASVLWVAPVSPHWRGELSRNMAFSAVQGGQNDPYPDLDQRRSPLIAVIDLQAVASVFRDEPGFYNAVSYAVCGSMLALVFWRTWRRRPAKAEVWLGLAALAPLTLLVTYHRPYDAKLLLLAVPAAAALWARGDRLGRWAGGLTGAAVFFTSDLPLTVVRAFTVHLRLDGPGLVPRLEQVFFTLEAPLALLAMAVFFTWVYVRRPAVVQL